MSVFKTSGEFVTSFGQFSYPVGILIDDDGFVFELSCNCRQSLHLVSMYSFYLMIKLFN